MIDGGRYKSVFFSTKKEIDQAQRVSGVHVISLHFLISSYQSQAKRNISCTLAVKCQYVENPNETLIFMPQVVKFRIFHKTTVDMKIETH